VPRPGVLLPSVLTSAATATALIAAMTTAVPTAGAAPTPSRSGGGSFVLTARHVDSRYAPTFTGNGYLGVRVPPTGQGYAGGKVPALSEVAGFYADPPNDVQKRADIPTWSTLGVSAGHGPFALDNGRVSRWRQRINLHDGVITTSARWRSPGGRVTELRYEVLTDRARGHVAAVRLTFTPHWSGRAVVTNILDGRPATLSKSASRGRDARTMQVWEGVRAVGTGLVAGVAGRVALSGVTRHAVRPAALTNSQSVGQRISFMVRPGAHYAVTKFVGVATSNDASAPVRSARRQAAAAARRGFAALLRENSAAWHALWAGRIDVLGNRRLATEVNASEFYLWSSTRPGVDWSISPSGLSSDAFNGHIFWDAETWMHPSLLAQHPALAAAMDAYRFQRLRAAEAHARATGFRGARYPWESALRGDEQIPGPVSVNSEGLFEQHITADIALAQWQYFLATGDRRWLRARGWPVISHAAAFWASRVTRDANGRFHITHVTGPDEENPDVNDEAYTNVAAAHTLRIATSAARALGKRAPAAWRTIAAHLVVPFDSARGIHPEFSGYQGQLVKQADVTMLQYPWQKSMPAAVAQRDLNFYVPRSDPGGPSMSDAINSIDTAALGSAGCAAYVYTERSILPFMRDVFDQFSETNTGGAFTFMTGIGGFLQEFLYGYSGLRLAGSRISLDPMLSAQLGGIVLHRVAWHGRLITVDIGRSSTRVTLERGPRMTVAVRGAGRSLRPGHPITIGTRRPDARRTGDLVRCGAATASTSARGMIALAAVDGSPATDWKPTALPARLTIRLHGAHTVHRASVLWGRTWPGPPGPSQPPPPTPVRTQRPSAYNLLVSSNGRTWRTVARVRGATTRTRDSLTFPATSARFVRLRIISAAKGVHPMLEELRVSR
jgi:trehalose/maltose hydrolase-like predicted phosphorylase